MTIRSIKSFVVSNKAVQYVYQNKSTITTALVLSLLATEPAFAQWADKTNTVLTEVIKGLKTLGIGIATLCILWSAYQLIWGGKRLQDMVPFFIGAAVFLAGPEIVKLFFGSP